jgi:hypothetical protein
LHSLQLRAAVGDKVLWALWRFDGRLGHLVERAAAGRGRLRKLFSHLSSGHQILRTLRPHHQVTLGTHASGVLSFD